MFIDYIFIAVIAAGALRGWWRGYLRTVADIIGLVGGYILIYVLAADVGTWISINYGIHKTLGTVLAGAIMFTGASVLATLAGVVVKTRRTSGMDAHEKEEYLIEDQNQGSWIGLIQGLLLSCLVALMLSILPAENKIYAALELKDSMFVDFMKPFAPVMLETVTANMFDDAKNGRIMAAILMNPEETKQAAQKVAESESMKELVTSTDFQNLLKTGTPDQLAQSPDLKKVLNDPKIIDAFKSLGVSQEDLQITPEDMATIMTRYRAIMDEINSQGQFNGQPVNIETMMSDPQALTRLMKILTDSPSNGFQQSGTK